ncbi:MAG: hypothetical protein B6229_02195 [Spirochaetaceae bacterium 4572_7]|nr:MAG: hypothetical protein B6229_02195 [Spirochaetaceae bacterium 4572_7]
MKALIVDDHPIFLNGLANVLNSLIEDIEIEEEINGKSAIKKILNKNYDLVILDFRLKDITGLQILKEVKHNVTSKFIMVTMYNDNEILSEVLKAGADGYVLKENTVTEMQKAIETVFNDKIYVDSFFDRLDNYEENYSLKNINLLTKQEKNILKLISNKYSSKEIAEKLSISFKTVDNHRSNISHKLKLKGKNSLLLFSIENLILINSL